MRSLVLLFAGTGVSGGVLVGRAEAAEEESSEVVPAAAVVLPAYAFDRGNAKIWTDTYADPEPMIAWGGQYPVFVEYALVLPVAAQDTVSVRFAQADLRPAQLTIDAGGTRRSAERSAAG